MTTPALECLGSWSEDCGCGHHNPCWPRPNTDCCKKLGTDSDIDPDTIERMLHIAVDILWRMSGKQFGLCPITVRPCRDRCQPSSTINWGGVLNPYLLDGQWFNGDPCGKCTTGCSCTELCEVTLPGPVESIVEIQLDGIVLAPSEYRVDDHRKLVAMGEVCWPTCQDLSLPAGQAGTWTVTYRRGLPVPASGLWAAGLLACELIKACAPEEGECKLPSNIQRIAREGVTVDLEPLLVTGDTFGRTGIPEVDLWLTSINPYKRAGRSQVYSPDIRRPRTTTWPCS